MATTIPGPVAHHHPNRWAAWLAGAALAAAAAIGALVVVTEDDDAAPAPATTPAVSTPTGMSADAAERWGS